MLSIDIQHEKYIEPILPISYTIFFLCNHAMVYYNYYYCPPRRTCNAPTSFSIFDGLTLHPLPYPVLVILVVIFSFLGISRYNSYEEIVEETEDGINWALLAAPVLLLLIVRWISSTENSQGRYSPYYYYGKKPCPPLPCERTGASPWGVACLILLCLILVQYQSLFLDRWFI